MKEKKRYVVWNGNKAGVFTSWDEVKNLVLGFKGAKYKSFKTQQEAEIAFTKGWEQFYTTPKKNENTFFQKRSIAVDAACSSASHIMEYQGINLDSGEKIFYFSYPEGTNNIGEFLAIVHGLSWIKQQGTFDYVIYSDSKVAINWVKQGVCRTSFVSKIDNGLLHIIKRAEKWLKDNKYTTEIIKWNTQDRGEIPADFGRK